MLGKTIFVAIIVVVSASCFGQRTASKTIDAIFSKKQQQTMGLHKLTVRERQELFRNISTIAVRAFQRGQASTKKRVNYVGLGGGHWVKKNVGSGKFIVLEDNSLWEVDRLERLDASLWLPISDITVVRSSKGSPGYDYLLINTDDGEKAHARYVGKQK